MGFMDAYKRLEKLCGDVMGDDRRISAYIDVMERLLPRAYMIGGWEQDLKQLKHYRWVRNQIAHKPDCTEEDLCSFVDEEWILGFYDRIMHQTDPLALYRKATAPRPKPAYKPAPAASRKPEPVISKPVHRPNPVCAPEYAPPERHSDGGLVAFLKVVAWALVIAIVAVICYLFKFLA